MNNKLIFDIETTGLNSIEDRITCISLLNVEHDNPTSFYGEREKLILQQFWASIDSSDILYGYNSNNFDWKFLIHRSLINNVKICENYNSLKKVDLRQVINSFFLTYNKFEKGTLNDWAKILGEGEKETNGKEVIEFYKQKNWKGIKKHCEEDCILTKKLLQRIIDCNLLQNE